MNERLLLGHVRSNSSVSRSELAKASGLSKPTVAVALASLERDGLVQAAGTRPGVRGPAAALYELSPQAGFVLGLDVGRRYLRGALADLRGQVRVRSSRTVGAASGPARLRELIGLGDELERSCGLSIGQSLQVVIGSPGVFDPERQAITLAPNLPGWERPGILAALQEAFGPSTVVENDVDLAALAEREHGHGQDFATFCFVSVGSGIGMGLVIDGRLHRGAHGFAGEIAYLPIDEPGASDPGTRRPGSFESLASAAGVVRRARRHGLRGPVSARRVFAAAEAGDPRALKVVADEARLVARAVSSVVAVVDPPLVVLGGGIGQAPGFAASVEVELRAIVPVVPEVRVSALAGDGVVDGCLAAGIERAWQRLLDKR